MTLVLGNVLPDCSAGFVVTDRRLTLGDRSGYADTDGKIARTPHSGWVTGGFNDAPAFTVAAEAVRNVRRIASGHRSESAHAVALETVVRSALWRAALPTMPGEKDEHGNVRHARTVVLEPCADGVSLCLLDSADCRALWDVSLFPADIGDERAATFAGAWSREVRTLPVDLGARIVAAARHFAEIGAYSRLISSVIEVALIRLVDGAPVAGFLRGEAAALGAADPSGVLTDYAVPFPARAWWDADIATWTPFVPPLDLAVISAGGDR